MAERERVSFDADPDSLALISAKQRGQKSAYINSAIRTFEHPPYRIVEPRFGLTESLQYLIEQANEIICVGTTLKTIPDMYDELLRDRITRHVPMTFIIMNPYVDSSDCLYQVLVRQTGEEQFVDAILQRGRTTLDYFRTLRDIGHRYETRVDVRVYNEVPMCGLGIANPHSSKPLMRVNFYTNMLVTANHPHLVIDTETEEGRAAYRVFNSYYDQLLRKSVGA